MTYTVYILQSQVDGTFYIGYTNNLERRLSEHNEGRTRYSSKKRPWILFYSEEYMTKREAIMRERFLKYGQAVGDNSPDLLLYPDHNVY